MGLTTLSKGGSSAGSRVEWPARLRRIAVILDTIKVVVLEIQSAFAVLDAIKSIENAGF
jgi:hypothetical protein